MLVARRPPPSNDLLVDALFKILVNILRKEIAAIYLKKNLRYPNKKKQALYGLLIHETGEIYLDKPKYKSDRGILISTLVHELLHQAIPSANEWRIRSLEKALCAHLTDAQKRFFRTFIPKRETKHAPNLGNN